MRSITITLLCTIVPVAATVANAAAIEKPISLKQAPGLDKVEANCAACHSLDYVQMNSKFLNAAGWNAEVAKMVNVFGAPINAPDAKTVGDYLTTNYGVPDTTK